MAVTLTNTGITFSNGQSLSSFPDVFAVYGNSYTSAGDNNSFYYQGSFGASASWQLMLQKAFVGATGSTVRFRATAVRGFESSGKSATTSYSDIRVNGTSILTYGNGGSTWAWSGNVDRTMTTGDIITCYGRSNYNGYTANVGYRISIAQSGGIGIALMV